MLSHCHFYSDSYTHQVFSVETQTHPTTSYFVIALYVFDECPPPCFALFLLLILQGVAHSTPLLASLFQSLLKALKGKILLPFLLMPF